MALLHSILVELNETPVTNLVSLWAIKKVRILVHLPWLLLQKHWLRRLQVDQRTYDISRSFIYS